MRRIRIIPTLIFQNQKLVKTVRFRNPGYLGDPINVLKIFNDKEVDEIVVLDINATRDSKPPDLDYIKLIAGECFMPVAYGGGVFTLRQGMEIFECGIEKLILGLQAHRNPNLITQIAKETGSQSIVVSIDCKKDWLGRSRVYVKNGTINTGFSPMEYAKKMEAFGAGELLLQNIDREGTLQGYDTNLIEEVCNSVSIPVIASGGASSLADFFTAIQCGASAAAAGHMFVYQGPHKAVLINYPTPIELKTQIYDRL